MTVIPGPDTFDTPPEVMGSLRDISTCRFREAWRQP